MKSYWGEIYIIFYVYYPYIKCSNQKMKYKWWLWNKFYFYMELSGAGAVNLKIISAPAPAPAKKDGSGRLRLRLRNTAYISYAHLKKDPKDTGCRWVAVNWSILEAV